MSDDILTRAAAYLTDPEADLVHFHRLIHEFIAELETTRAQLRQVGRQLGLFLENGERIRVIVALAITDGTPEENR